MLQTIREHTQGWIASIIILLLVLVFALWGIHSYFVSGSDDNIVAVVNGTDITKAQLALTYDRLRKQAQLQTSFDLTSSNQEAVLKEKALHSLVDVEVLKQASMSQGFRISDNQIDSYLESMPEFQVNGVFSVSRFQELLSSSLLSTNEFLSLIHNSLLIDQPRLGIMLSSFAMPLETDQTFALVNQTRHLNYLVIPTQYVKTAALQVPTASIKAYYEQHRAEFMTLDQVKVQYLMLSVKDLTNEIKPTESVLKNFYNENINAYTQPMQWKFAEMEFPLAQNATGSEALAVKQKADNAFNLLTQGKPFNDVAKGYMGELTFKGWLTLNQVPEALQHAVANLTKVGQFSAPIRTSKGFVILSVSDIQEPKIQPFDVVKDRIYDSYVRQQAEEKFASMRDQLANLTYEHPDSLQTAAIELHLPVLKSEFFSKDKEGGHDISQFKKAREIAFSDDVLNLQNNSDIIQLNSETIAVLRIDTHLPARLMPLKEVSPQIETRMKAKLADDQVRVFATQLQTQLMYGGTDQAAVAAKYNLSWRDVGFVNRYAAKIDPALLDELFRLPNPAYKNGTISYGVARLPTGYAVIALSEVKAGSVDPKQYHIFAEQVQNGNGFMEYELYRQSQEVKARVKISNSD